MSSVIERIARHADIDTRRAMGFLPRRLGATNLNLLVESREYIEFNQGISRFIKLRDANVYVCPNEIWWVFGTDDFKSSRSYSFQWDGRTSFYAMLIMKHAWHPDFNEDGSFKRDRARWTPSSPRPVAR